MYNLNYDDLLFQLRQALRFDDQEMNENGRYQTEKSQAA